MKKNDLDSEMKTIYNLLNNRQISSAIKRIGLYMEQHDNCGMADEYQLLADDFRRMHDYWLSDMKDPSLEAMVEQFSRRTATFCSEYISRLLNLEDSCYLLMERNRVNRKGDSWNWQDIRQKLEAFVTRPLPLSPLRERLTMRSITGLLTHTRITHKGCLCIS